MHGLPKDFDASFLVNCTLDMVSFNANQIVLYFDGNIKISVESILIYQNDKETQTLSPPVGQTNLMELLGHTITQASGKSDGTLSMIFNNGHKIECLDDSKNYESYQISVGDKLIVV